MSNTPPTSNNSDADQIIGYDDDGIRVDRWFKRHRPDVPHALLSRWARLGQLRIDGAKTTLAERLVAGQTLRAPALDAAPAGATVRQAKERRPVSPAEAALADAMVIHRDASAIVLNKPPGLATQGGTGTTEHVDGLLDALVDERGVRPRLVHRLDKDTSGVLLVARSPGAAARFSKSFAGRSARKTYWAIVTGVPEVHVGEIELALAKQPGSGGEKMHVDQENGQAALTRYRVIDRAGNQAAFVELQPLTGRTHQLRVHMAAIGHPIVGDGKYGGKAAFLTGSISRKLHLHARRLRIGSPGGGTLDVTAALPSHFAESLASLGFDEAAGDARGAPVEPTRAPKEIAKAKAKAHAKTYRKERRGERRGRGVAAAPSAGFGSGTPRPPARKARPKPAPKSS